MTPTVGSASVEHSAQELDECLAATAAAVETRAGTLSTEINQKMITDLPLNGRNVLQLLAVTPGTLNTNASAFNQGATRPESASQLVSVSGGRGNSTTFTLDGGLHEDPYTEVANVAPNPDAARMRLWSKESSDAVTVITTNGVPSAACASTTPT